MPDFSDSEVTVSDSELREIRERVLQAEKAKLDMDNPIGVINDIEQIIREEIQE